MTIRPGFYKHYKGKLYQVFGMSRHSETLEEMVVYQALYGNYGLWVRPAAMFMGTLSIDGVDTPRFAWVSEGVCASPALN